jgi:hypothetical protein
VGMASKCIGHSLSLIRTRIVFVLSILWWGEVDHQWPRPFSAPGGRSSGISVLSRWSMIIIITIDKKT